MKFAIAAFFLIAPMTLHAQTCQPPKTEINIKCEDCGNLERNSQRGIDLTHKAAKENELLMTELSLFGAATLILAHPTHSSRGNRWYQGAIENPSFTITNQASYARAVSAYREWRDMVGVSISVPPNVSFDAAQAASLEQTWRREIGVSTSSGMSPYIVTVYDKKGKELGREEILQSAPARINPIYPEAATRLEYAKEHTYQNLGCRPPPNGRRKGAPRGGAFGGGFLNGGFSIPGFGFGGGNNLVCTSRDLYGRGSADLTRLVVTTCRRG